MLGIKVPTHPWPVLGSNPDGILLIVNLVWLCNSESKPVTKRALENHKLQGREERETQRRDGRETAVTDSLHHTAIA